MDRQNSATDPKDQTRTGDVVVFCDESGAKGYADQVEKEPGEFGIFTGFPVPREFLERFAGELRASSRPSETRPVRFT
jgi:hypothetical protein